MSESLNVYECMSKYMYVFEYDTLMRVHMCVHIRRSMCASMYSTLYIELSLPKLLPCVVYLKCQSIG